MAALDGRLLLAEGAGAVCIGIFLPAFGAAAVAHVGISSFWGVKCMDEITSPCFGTELIISFFPGAVNRVLSNLTRRRKILFPVITSEPKVRSNICHVLRLPLFTAASKTACIKCIISEL
jgi:hypothetical protein